MKEYTVFIDTDGDPHITMKDNGVERMCTLAECQRAVTILNEEGSNIIRLHCRTVGCKSFGGWIERTREQSSKSPIMCDECNRPMER